eukprot:CAMPEP_0197903994 /NCGR_PEP_ID=MMETSP1439-20131203/57075_1 /TAXON_ID=66791 /ORGANISM="Gonyaulax spinifera, Strain CCMP409" /LENGTH=80 /DNA_ID=CAMNT_0043525155 /DNA_START=55 /DNA_END=293 /DNA_ORIENTATION=+
MARLLGVLAVFLSAHVAPAIHHVEVDPKPDRQRQIDQYIKKQAEGKIQQDAELANKIAAYHKKRADEERDRKFQAAQARR